MEERIKARIAELAQAEREAELQLIAIRQRLAELRDLIEAPIMTEGEST